MPTLLDALINAIAEKPGLKGREYARILRGSGFPGLTRSDVNSVLYSRRDIFTHTVGDGGVPAWFLIDNVALPVITIAERDEIDWDDDISIGLYPWQIRALNEWTNRGFNGVVEAVTGAGKTHVGLAAIEAHLRLGWKALVVVPSIALQTQWENRIRRELSELIEEGYEIGFLGGNRRGNGNWDMLIAIVNSLINRDPNEILAGGQRGLIIADECHRYGAPLWADCLHDRFTRRMGLTATYERSDNGIEEYLDPYFTGICYSLNYDEALAEGVISPFKIAFIGTNFGEQELSAYTETDNRCRSLRRTLIDEYQVSSEPFGEFMREVAMLTEGGGGEATGIARSYMSSFNRRRKLIAGADQKFDLLRLISPSIQAAERTIIFTQTVEAAERAITTLRDIGITGNVMNSGMNMDDRQRVFAEFESGEEDVIAAPLLLDEGVDVPAADLAIILAASRSKRQMIQRMGRVLRLKEDGRLARVVILYIEGTAEDPNRGAHETFIELIRGVAEEEEIFSSNDDVEEINDFLMDWEPW